MRGYFCAYARKASGDSKDGLSEAKESGREVLNERLANLETCAESLTLRRLELARGDFYVNFIFDLLPLFLHRLFSFLTLLIV